MSNHGTLSRKQKLDKVEGIYQHCKALVLSDKHMCEIYEAIRLGAYILQAEHGDFDKAKHTPDALKDIRQYMPPQQALSNPKQNKKLLLAEYATLAGTAKPQAKLRFARICKHSPTFGMEFTPAHHRGQGKTSMVAALVGFTPTAIVVLEYKSKAVLQQFDLTKVVKWQGKAVGLQIDFKEHVPNSVFFATAGANAQLLTQRATAAIQLMLKTKQKKKEAKAVPEESTDDYDQGRGGDGDTFDGFEDSDDGDGNEEPSGKRYSGGSVGRTQAGFLSGVNMASQRMSQMGSGFFDLGGSSAMATLSRQSSAASGVTLAPSEPGDDEHDDWDDFLDDASDDITSSAGVLDSVARLGPKRTSHKWCVKQLKHVKEKVKSQVLGIASKCKKLVPCASHLTTSRAANADPDNRKLFMDTINLFCRVMPPLAGHIVTMAALTTVPGRNEELLVQAGDMWIGTLQLVQAVRETSKADVITGASQLATASKALIELMAELTNEDRAEALKKKEFDEMLLKTDAQRAERRKDDERQKAVAQAEAAMVEVERLAHVAMQQKSAAGARAAAEAEAERKRQEIAMKKAIENAERFAKQEGRRLAKEEAERAKREAKEEADRIKRAEVEEKRQAKAVEAERKRLVQVEKDRLAKIEADRLATIKAEKKAKFDKLLGAFETPSASPAAAAAPRRQVMGNRTSAAMTSLPP